MKQGSEKKKKLKLIIEEQIRYKVIGISSHENDYRLVWSMNEKLKMHFLRIENLLFHNARLKADLEFSRYLFHDEDRYLKLYLISNRCPDGFLFPELKNIDFLLQITGVINEAEMKDLVKKLKTVPVVSAVFVLEPEKIRGMGKVLEEI
jgi:hypothetical protein